MINKQECNVHSDSVNTIVFKRLSDNSYYVNSPCFLTIPAKTIQQNAIYLKAEGCHFDSIKILNVYFEDGLIHLLIEDLKTNRIYSISHIIGENYPCIWWLLSWDYLENEMMNRIKNDYNNNTLMEFDF